MESNPEPYSDYTCTKETTSLHSEDAELLFHSKSFKFIHLNVRSILPNIDRLQLESNNSDINALSETFLNKDVNDKDIKVSGYSNPFRRDRNRHGVARAFMLKKVFMQLDVMNLKMIILNVLHG